MKGAVGEDSLLECAKRSNLAGIRRALKSGQDIEVGDPEDSNATALMRVCSDGFAEGAKVLLAAGADVRARDTHGWSALSFACRDDHVDCVKLLIEAGCEVDVRHVNGMTPLIIAALNGNRECLWELVGAGADIEACDCKGRFALAEAASHGYGLGGIEALLSAGCQVERPIVAGNSDVVGSTAISLGAMFGHAKNVAVLIAAGARVDARSLSGRTALMVAAKHGHAGCVAALLQAGADAAAKCAEGLSAADYAKGSDVLECLALFEALRERVELSAATNGAKAAGPKRM
jgi:ankyrin repeat protein